MVLYSGRIFSSHNIHWQLLISYSIGEKRKRISRLIRTRQSCDAMYIIFTSSESMTSRKRILLFYETLGTITITLSPSAFSLTTNINFSSFLLLVTYLISTAWILFILLKIFTNLAFFFKHNLTTGGLRKLYIVLGTANCD